MEIYRVTSIVPAEGKGEAAISFLTKVVKYVNGTEAYNRHGKWELICSLDGPGKLHWVERFKSFAAFEEQQTVWENDPKRKGFEKEGRGLLGAAEEHFFRILT